MLHPRRATRGQAPRPALIAAVVVPVVLLVLFISVRLLGGERPETIVQNYLSDLQQKQSALSERWLTQSGGSPGTSNPPTGQYVPHLEMSSLTADEIPGATFEVGRSTINDSNAQVPVTVKFGDQTFVIPFHLVKEDGGWRIDRAATNAEILKQEDAINAASTTGTSSGEGGIPSGSGSSYPGKAPGP